MGVYVGVVGVGSEKGSVLFLFYTTNGLDN